MNIRIQFVLLFCVALSGAALAMLPDDGSIREPQLRAYRRRVREQYEQRLVERQEEAVRAYEQTRSAVFTPPWMRTSGSTEIRTSRKETSNEQVEKRTKQSPRLLISVILLASIGAFTGWVRYASGKAK